MDETTVGYAATGVLERECMDYIVAHTVNKRYVGLIDYLLKYELLRSYNAKR